MIAVNENFPYPPKKESRFHSAEQIEGLIDRAKARIDTRTKECLQAESLAHLALRQNPPDISEWRAKNSLADELRHKIRCDEHRLVRLKHKLAQIKTDLLPGMGEDTSIPR